MALSTVIAALQARHALLSGVASAPTAYPSSLNSVALPLVAVLPGKGIWHVTKRIGPNNQKFVQTRTVIVRVFVRPVAQGASVDTGFSEAVALLETFGDSYASNQNMGTGYALDGEFSDTGHVIIAYGEVNYHGFEFELPVREAP